jgi:hypothetical protein
MPLTRTMLTAVPTVILTALLGAGCADRGETSGDQRAAGRPPLDRPVNPDADTLTQSRGQRGR